MTGELSFQEWIERLISGDRRTLSRMITLVESSLEEDRSIASSLMQAIQPHRRKSIRIGITGTPGVGKSTFLNVFVSQMDYPGHKTAILTIDPSSEESGGSILGDKIRMKNLIEKGEVYIRSSPSKGILGGIGSYTWETIQLCEVAGYDLIFIETVGVGQSEIEIRYLTDEVWWLTLPRSGDEIQGMKKGIMEIIDRIIVTRKDQDPEGVAKTRMQLQRAMKTSLIQKHGLKYYEISSMESKSLSHLIQDFKTISFPEERKNELSYWFDRQWDQTLLHFMEEQEDIQTLKNRLREQVTDRKITPWGAQDTWRKKIEDQWKR